MFSYECDSTGGMTNYCDPYVKITVNDGESEPQVFTTNTIPNSAGFTTIDEMFYSKKLRKDTTEVIVEIYDANEEEIMEDDKLMYHDRMSLKDFLDSSRFSDGPNTELVALSLWRPEVKRNNETVSNGPKN